MGLQFLNNPTLFSKIWADFSHTRGVGLFHQLFIRELCESRKGNLCYVQEVAQGGTHPEVATTPHPKVAILSISLSLPLPFYLSFFLVPCFWYHCIIAICYNVAVLPFCEVQQMWQPYFSAPQTLCLSLSLHFLLSPSSLSLPSPLSPHKYNPTSRGLGLKLFSLVSLVADLIFWEKIWKSLFTVIFNK